MTQTRPTTVSHKLFTMNDVLDKNALHILDECIRKLDVYPFSPTKRIVLRAYYNYWHDKLSHGSVKSFLSMTANIVENTATMKSIYALIDGRDYEFLRGIKMITADLSVGSNLKSRLENACHEALEKLMVRRNTVQNYATYGLAAYCAFEFYSRPDEMLSNALFTVASLFFLNSSVGKHLVNELVEINDSTGTVPNPNKPEDQVVVCSHPAMRR